MDCIWGDHDIYINADNNTQVSELFDSFKWDVIIMFHMPKEAQITNAKLRQTILRNIIANMHSFLQ